MNDFKTGLKKTIDVYDRVLCAFGVLFYAAFSICVLVQVISRNFLPKAPSWTEELARYTFIYMVAFGCGVAVHRNEFVSVEFLHDSLEKNHPNINKVIDFVIKAIICVMSIFLLFKSVIPFAFIKFPMYSTALTIPMQYCYFAIVLLFGFLSIAYIMELLYMILTWKDSPVSGKEAAE